MTARMSEFRSITDQIANVLAAHRWWPGTPSVSTPGCYCGWRCAVALDAGFMFHAQHARHVAAALVPVVEAAQADAFDRGVKATQAEAEPWCSRSFACTRTPASPYRAVVSEAGEGDR